MSFNPNRMNVVGGGAERMSSVRVEPPLLTTECCEASMSPQRVDFEGAEYNEATCDDCGSLVCHDCGGPLDPRATAIE